MEIGKTLELPVAQTLPMPMPKYEILLDLGFIEFSCCISFLL